ncbi:trichoplein keratin filament-binding protein isoform X2 [Harmonia axyridis]|nr:trichoplein keratin filament-binding protein isoform X2 [Harmonia axyridis]XP_045468903.1 trichoplein keratin filament-binding protein isoform X2 [Harmonia axyridis]XP_045468905.1 trichoplein keratin filament-binding protein isoform X2 [Harmonia axyridis]XP_045468906.1 trichoplein keratin filament-binding protein isoform X2 [Harmonia axyridis]XP_045468907.1 trichoplein keratin filament-binding protein isoform X2 [Harmonia axyridis]
MTSRRRPLSREEQIIRKREKEYQHQKFWGDQQKYYDHWEKANTKYEEWTSPRYYDTNTQLVKQVQMEKILQERRELRRRKLRKLFEDERQLWEVELMEHKNKEAISPRNIRQRPDDIPTEILKQVHQGIKEREEEKRRKESELRLYHQWRNDNSFIQDYERAKRSKDIKTSWLHQQMAKRERKEKELAEEKRLLLDREERLRTEKERDEERKKQTERRNKELKEIIDKQVEEIQVRQTITARLRDKEVEERRRRNELIDLEERQKRMGDLAKQREVALSNIKQHKMKLKQKLKNIQDSLLEQEEIMKRLRDLEVAEGIEDERLKSDVKQSIEEFLKISGEQKRLEKLREKNMQFMFDSEVQAMYERQSEIWDNEERSRKKLIEDVLATVAEQIERNCQKTREEQEDSIKEREMLIKMTEDYNTELVKLQDEEKERQLKRKEELDRQVKKKQEDRKALEEDDKLKKVTEELERAKIEEERLKREIMNLHRGQGLYRPSNRSNIIF